MAVAGKYFSKTFPSETNTTDIEYIVLRCFEQDPSIVEDMLYEGFWVNLEPRSKSCDLTSKDGKQPAINLDKLTEENTTRPLREYFKGNDKKKSLKVWRILRNEPGTATLVIYIKANGRAKLAKVGKKGYLFKDHSVPIFLHFSEEGRKVEYYDRVKSQRPQKMATNLFADRYFSENKRSTESHYELRIFQIDEKIVRQLIDQLAGGKQQQMSIHSIKFVANIERNNSIIELTKQKDSVEEAISVIKKSEFQSEITPKTVKSIEVIFKSQRFLLSFMESKEKFEVTYSTKIRDTNLRREFEKFISENYNIQLNVV